MLNTRKKRSHGKFSIVEGLKDALKKAQAYVVVKMAYQSVRSAMPLFY